LAHSIELTCCALFSQALQLTKARMATKVAEIKHTSRIAELIEANAQLRAELPTAHNKVAEVKSHEQALSSDYDGLLKGFDDLQASHIAIVKGKANLEKTEREKVQRFQISCVGSSPSFGVIQKSQWLRLEDCLRLFGVVSSRGSVVVHRLFIVQRKYHLLHADWRF
jgi:seryl-tRNA synthetase